MTLGALELGTDPSHERVAEGQAGQRVLAAARAELPLERGDPLLSLREPGLHLDDFPFVAPHAIFFGSKGPRL